MAMTGETGSLSTSSGQLIASFNLHMRRDSLSLMGLFSAVRSHDHLVALEAVCILDDGVDPADDVVVIADAGKLVDGVLNYQHHWAAL